MYFNVAILVMLAVDINLVAGIKVNYYVPNIL